MDGNIYIRKMNYGYPEIGKTPYESTFLFAGIISEFLETYAEYRNAQDLEQVQVLSRSDLLVLELSTMGDSILHAKNIFSRHLEGLFCYNG